MAQVTTENSAEGLLATVRASRADGPGSSPCDAIVALGSAAVDPMKRCLSHDDPTVQRVAIAVLERLAVMGMASAADALRRSRDIVAIENVPHLITAEFRASAAALNEPPQPPELQPVGVSRASVGPSFAATAATAAVIERINEARALRGEPALDAAEAQQVVANLALHSADPARYRNVCWHCRAVVDAATNEECPRCGWRVCWCGACRSPTYRDRTGRTGACRRAAWALARQIQLPDYDVDGRPILTGRPPSSDASEIRDLTRKRRVGGVCHWSPERAIPTVLEFGLLSRPELDVRGIGYVPHAYGSRAKAATLGRYVALSVRPKSQMMADWSLNPVVWEIDPEVLTTQGTLFVRDNSARREIGLGEVLSSNGARSYAECLDAVEVVGQQVEFLVPLRVPRIALRRAIVRDSATAGALRQEAARAGLTLRVLQGQT